MEYKFQHPVPKEYNLEKDYYEKDVIRKKDLVHNAKYKGLCRNTEEAIWNAEENAFVYDRFKFGLTYEDYIEHIEDDSGYDVFLPTERIN